MNERALEESLAGIGIAGRVEAMGRIAVVTTIGSMPLDAAARRRAVGMARENGFANVCIELTAVDAGLPGH
jgi:hypothetical protein